jgi:hypothetical protein
VGGWDVPDAVNLSSVSAAAAATVKANESTGMMGGDNSSVANDQTNNDAAPVGKGDYVKVSYKVQDMFGNMREEW